MQITTQSAPHLRRPKAKVPRMMGDVSIALLPLVIFVIYQHGLNGLMILSAAVLSMMATEYLFYQLRDRAAGEKFKLKNKSFTLNNFTVLTSGLIYGLILPDQTPLMIVIIGGVVGVFFAKLIFGGVGYNIFNIAGFARVFVSLSYTASTAYEKFIDSTAGASALGILSGNPFDSSVTDTYSYWQLFSGIGLPGSLGETSALLILVGGLYLFLRKSFDAYVPLTYLLTVFVLASAVMLTQDGVGFWYPMTHLLAGGLMFGAIYMATDPVSIPLTRPGRIYFAVGLGVITFVIRLFGNLPEGVVFAILIMNMFVPLIDYPRWSHNKFNVKRAAIFAAVVLVTVVLTVLGVQYGL